MSGLYNLPISGLKEGRHYYEFEIDKEFFNKIEESEVKDGSLTATIEADKRSSHIDLEIRIKGEVFISCDRCLEIFSYPVNCENRLLIKMGRTSDESDPDIITLPAEEGEYDLSQYFYEYITLSLPIKRVHPDDKDGKPTCDPEMLKKLQEHIVNEESSNDPRWDELKKLINNN